MGVGHLVEAVKERGSFWMCGIGSRVTNLPMKTLCKMAHLGDKKAVAGKAAEVVWFS